MLLLSMFVFSIISVSYLYIGAAFWRVHKETFLRLSIYDLTQQIGLIENFGENYLGGLKALNRVALDTLSFHRLMKLFLGWPVYLITFHRALNFAAYSSRLLGDEKTEKLRCDLLDQGFPQADFDPQKRKAFFKEGFLIRRLDEELVSVFWHTPHGPEGVRSEPPSQASSPFANVLRFRVPTQVRMQRLQEFVSKREGSPYWAQGNNQKTTPYIVIYEPYSFGKVFAFKDVALQIRKDLRSLAKRLVEGGNSAKLVHENSRLSLQNSDLRAEKAFVRFLKSTSPKLSDSKSPL
jgi:hypothetical protein